MKEYFKLGMRLTTTRNIEVIIVTNLKSVEKPASELYIRAKRRKQRNKPSKIHPSLKSLTLKEISTTNNTRMAKKHKSKNFMFLEKVL